jgi:hypothetical protein
MQFNSVYLYPNKIDVFTNTVADWLTERYCRVYNRNLKIYRSVDNRIDFQVRNSDQKPATIAGTTLVFNIITREGKDLLLSKDCTVVSTTSGRAYVTLTAAEMLTLENGQYNYSLTQEVRTDIDNNNYKVTSRKPMYQDSQYGTIGTIEVLGDVLGDTESSEVVDKFELINPATTGYEDPKYYTSSYIDAIGNTQVAQSLHTFQIYSTNYTGTVKIQGSLSEGGVPTAWTDIETITLTTATQTYKNVTGKYNFFRIRHYPTTGTVDKILFR